ncbi:unnamed protein product [Alopecurus aequalis]
MNRKRRPAVVACSMERPSALAARSNKRARGLIAPAAILDEAYMWGSLEADLVDLIGWMVLANDVRDYVRFRAICPHWRSSSVCPRGRGMVDPRFHPRRWMMLPEGHGLYPGHSKLRGYIRFFNLSTGVIVRVLLPLFRDHCILDSVDGLLLLQRDEDTAIRLVHPFTSDIAELPPLATLLRLPKANLDVRRTWMYLRQIRGTSFSVSADGVVTVMIVFYKISMLAFATSSDDQWNVPPWRLSPSTKPISSQGKIYMLDNPNHYGGSGDTQIFQIDPPQYELGIPSGSSPVPTKKFVTTCPASKMCVPHYLAECGSEVLVIGYHRDGFFRHPLVYRLSDLILDRAVPVTSIGDNVLLIGERILSVSPSVVNIAGDSMVAIHPREKYLAQCQLSTSTWSQAADGQIAIRGSVSRPYSFIYHIYTCCLRAAWNKGVIYHQYKGQPAWKVKRKWREGVSLICDNLILYYPQEIFTSKQKIFGGR